MQYLRLTLVILNILEYNGIYYLTIGKPASRVFAGIFQLSQASTYLHCIKLTGVTRKKMLRGDGTSKTGILLVAPYFPTQ